MSFLEIRNLSFSYNQKRMVLKHIDLSVEKGEWIAILGHNGSGKSTLAKTIVGLLRPAEGSITVDGTLLSDETAYDIRRKVGIVFQNPDNQFVGVTVKDDIAFGMENLSVPRAEMIEKIAFFAEKVGMAEYLEKEPSALSGGQKQRIAIAGILAMKTDMIIFDEATSMLDPTSRRELMDYIRELHDEGLTVLMITHDIEEALMADRLVVLKDGAVFADDTAEHLFKRPEAFREAYLELPAALKIYYELEAAGDMTPPLATTLWRFGSGK
ncbi:MAG: energy-coupling factor transporter ATPase [Tenericutes bacterium GWF2_57_13]|nr:MAG: energy-coupling factor transporter ATPase [Tenericutes bacterium GWF2_57_13]